MLMVILIFDVDKRSLYWEVSILMYFIIQTNKILWRYFVHYAAKSSCIFRENIVILGSFENRGVETFFLENYPKIFYAMAHSVLYIIII